MKQLLKYIEDDNFRVVGRNKKFKVEFHEEFLRVLHNTDVEERNTDTGLWEREIRHSIDDYYYTEISLTNEIDYHNKHNTYEFSMMISTVRAIIFPFDTMSEAKAFKEELIKRIKESRK